jgi:uncharacterized protein YaaQ
VIGGILSANMKLVVCIVHNRDRNRLCDQLVKSEFKFTVIGSSGGFLREGNTTLLSCVQDDKLDLLKQIIEVNCRAREQVVNAVPYESAASVAFVPSAMTVQVGGAVVFVVEVNEFVRF